MRAALLIVLVACAGASSKGGHGDHGSDPPCAQTSRADLVAPGVSKAKLGCMTTDVRDARPAFADLVLSLDWTRSDTKATLAKIPADAADWYGLADVVADKNPKVALELYGLASERAATSDVRIAVNARELRVAKALAGQEPDSDAAVVRARERLLANASSGTLEKMQVLQVLVEQKEQPAIQTLCSDTSDPALVWPCVENDPAGLTAHLPQIASLTQLSYKDVPRLRKLPGGKLVDNGLRCRASDPRDFIDLANNRSDYSGDQVLLYYRLRDGAPKADARCLLQNAALGCLQLVQANKVCPTLSVFADYFRTLSRREQDELLEGVYFMKGMFYRLRVFEDHSRDAEAVLFHLHLLLADLLSETNVGPREQSRLPQFQVERAMSFFNRSPEPGVRFWELLSEKTIGTVCGDPNITCSESCMQGYSGCERDCKTLSRSITPTCPALQPVP